MLRATCAVLAVVCVLGCGSEDPAQRHGAYFSVRGDKASGWIVNHSCDHPVYGECTVIEPGCSSVQKGSAGEVTLKSGTQQAQMTFSPDMSTYEAAIDVAPGAVATVTATGDTAPPFELSVTRPQTAPAVVLPEPSKVTPRTEDLALEWSPGLDADRVVVSLLGEPAKTYIQCSYAPAPNGGIVPAASLLRSFGAGESVTITALAMNNTVETSGNWELGLNGTHTDAPTLIVME